MKVNVVKNYLIAFFLFLAFTACEKTVEGELSSWERNVNKVNVLAGKYPQFRTHLMDILKDAEEQKETALEIPSKEEQIKALSQANGKLRVQFIQDIEAINPAIEEISEQLMEIEQNFSDADYSKEIYKTLVEAENSVKEVTENISRAEGDLITVQGLVRIEYEKLKKYESRLQRIIDNKEEADTKKAEITKAEEQKEANTIEVEETVKCSYCGSSNPKLAEKCKSCAAIIKTNN